jgi:hypothetical protein
MSDADISRWLRDFQRKVDCPHESVDSRTAEDLNDAPSGYGYHNAERTFVTAGDLNGAPSGYGLGTGKAFRRRGYSVKSKINRDRIIIWTFIFCTSAIGACVLRAVLDAWRVGA